MTGAGATRCQLVFENLSHAPGNCGLEYKRGRHVHSERIGYHTPCRVMGRILQSQLPEGSQEFHQSSPSWLPHVSTAFDLLKPASSLRPMEKSLSSSKLPALLAPRRPSTQADCVRPARNNVAEAAVVKAAGSVAESAGFASGRATWLHDSWRLVGCMAAARLGLCPQPPHCCRLFVQLRCCTRPR
jgi:hypothetical protein